MLAVSHVAQLVEPLYKMRYDAGSSPALGTVLANCNIRANRVRSFAGSRKPIVLKPRYGALDSRGGRKINRVLECVRMVRSWLAKPVQVHSLMVRLHHIPRDLSTS